jgi:hypothetical protein
MSLPIDKTQAQDKDAVFQERCKANPGKWDKSMFKWQTPSAHFIGTIKIFDEVLTVTLIKKAGGYCDVYLQRSSATCRAKRSIAGNTR